MLGVVAVLESLELANVESLLKQIRLVKEQTGVRSAVSELVSLLKSRRSTLQDDAARDVLGKLATRLDHEASSGKDTLLRTLQVAELHFQALARPFSQVLLEKSWFDPREGRVAAHNVASVAVQNQGRELVERGRKLANVVANVTDAETKRVNELKRLVATLLGKARSHLENGAEKAEMAEICRQLYDQLAKVASEQRQNVEALLQKNHLAKGDLIKGLLRVGLVAVGSDSHSTSSVKLEYVWPAKKKTAKVVAAASPVVAVAAAAKKPQQQHQQSADSKLLPFMGVCSVCKEDVHGRVVKALNAVFHPDHFACSSCRRVIAAHESFMADPAHPLRPVCSACGSQAVARAASTAGRPMQSLPGSLGPCGTCGRGVAGEHVSVLGKIFHAACLQCGNCGRTMRPSEQLAKGEGGFIICAVCANPSAALAAPRAVAAPPPAASKKPAPRVSARRVCAECRLDLEDGEALMDAGELFHRLCFVCKTCKQPLGADFFMSGGQRQCRECYKFDMYKCFACMKPLHKHGSDVEHNGRLYHLSCAPRPLALPSKPLPQPAASPASSPPPSPPAARPPRWSGDEASSSSSSSSIEPPPRRPPPAGRDDLDDLMSEFLMEENPEQVPLSAPLLRTSRSSRASGAKVETCWSCGAANPVDYIECRECGEAGLVGEERGSVFSLPVQGQVVEFDRDSSVADEDQLSALIMELGDI